jgi:hypothetical protein
MRTPRLSALLSEVERQDRYLAELPAKYNFPLFDGRLAVESQRKSGYKDTARAAREIVDNAVEAGAKNVRILLDKAGEAAGREKGARRDGVVNVAFIDDGPGMRPRMIRAALAWGGGTHGKEPGRIGRFGFGLPNSSINQTRRVEVYSKTADAKGWSMAALDINEGKVPEHGLVRIEPESEDVELPDFVQKYLEKKKIELKSGTIVVWVRPDRLTYRTAGMLANLMREDFGVTYRFLLDEFALFVEDESIQKVDPLFLMKDAMFYLPPESGGATCPFEKALAVKFYRDPVTGAQHLAWLRSKEDLAEAKKELAAASKKAVEEGRKEPHLVIGTMHVRVARFGTYGFAFGATRDPDKKPLDEHSKKRFAIRKSRRGMAFVRGGREIDTLHVFPSEQQLGDWPLLQSYAYHWGVEVSFDAVLDDAFGVGHDKQSVRPIEDFWRVLHDAEVDAALRQEQRQQGKLRETEKNKRAARELADSENSAAMQSAALASDATGARPLPEEEQEKARARVREVAHERAKQEGTTVDQAEKAIEAEAQRCPFALGHFDDESGPFFKPDLGNGLQKVVLINRKHPFFEVFYSHLVLRQDARSKGAVDVMLAALADYELTATGSARNIVQYLRENHLSNFLKVGLRQFGEIGPAPVTTGADDKREGGDEDDEEDEEEAAE